MSLYQHPDSSMTEFPKDEIAFPMSWDRSIICLYGPIGDRSPMLQATCSVWSPTSASLLSSCAQICCQAFAEAPSSGNVKRPIDCLVGHAHAGIVGEIDSQTMGDLLGRPPLFKKTFNDGFQPDILR